ncbi:MAG: hypothetical protein ACXAEU_25190 [Candidatus Hodarchaeales archaeon]|jgi:hypothetical protein
MMLFLLTFLFKCTFLILDFRYCTAINIRENRLLCRLFFFNNIDLIETNGIIGMKLVNLSTLTLGASCEFAEPLTGELSFYLWLCVAEDPCTPIITVTNDDSSRDRLFTRHSSIDPLEDHSCFPIDFCPALIILLFYRAGG